MPPIVPKGYQHQDPATWSVSVEAIENAVYDLKRAVVNVKDYGAVGDGTADDATAFQDALNDVSGAGASGIIVPRATYRLAASSTVPSDVVIYGDQATIKVDTSIAGGAHRAPFELFGGENVTFAGLRFEVDVDNAGISAFGWKNLTVRDCVFTGAGAENSAMINLSTYEVDPHDGAKILFNKFVDCTAGPAIQLHAHSARTISDTTILGNRFEAVFRYGVKFTAIDTMVRSTRIIGNEFVDLIKPASGYSFAVTGGLDAAYKIEDVLIADNSYRSTRNESKIFVGFYSSRKVRIKDNVAVDTGTSDDTSFFTPGRLSDPLEDFVVSGNVVEGFGSFWDADSMRRGNVCDNVVKDCKPNGGLQVGYGVQEYIDIHDNTFYNCYNTTVGNAAAVLIGTVSPAAKKVTVHDNLIVDDQGTPNINKFVYTSGAGAFDSSDVTIERNRVYVPSGAVTLGVTKQDAANVPPRSIRDNEIHSSAGRITPEGTASITVTASPFTYTAGTTPEAIYIRGGTVSDISKNSRTIFAASPATVWLEPGEAVVVTYSVAPTMEKDRK